ncbi:hypothetical protein JB92DRAFT_3103962 [Gautieria morchelliformis]|nr:hypothetical protein JB92DRAFT_3103962 [Gautieria morchelliformis]
MADNLGLTASIIAVLQLTAATISACYSYGNGVKNATRDKERTIDQLFGLQKVLETIRRLVGHDETVAASRLPVLNEVIPRCRAELDSLNSKLERDLGRKGRIQAFIWPLKESEVNKTLEKLGKLQDLLTAAMDLDQTCLTLKIDSGVEALLEQGAKNSQLTQDMKSGVQALQETTAGISGAMEQAKQRTSHIARLAQERQSFAIAFFYFDFNNKDTLPNAVLRSLIKQLSVCTNTFHILESLFPQNEHSGAHRDQGQEALMNALKSIVKSYQTVYIVFDALDEFPERSRFLEVIEEINDWKFDKLHLMATSRKERDIEETLGGLISHEVCMHKSLVDGDIRVHVSRTLDHDKRFRMCSAEEKEMVKTTLINGAHGMFRWVVCQLDALRKCRTPAALKKALTGLPKTLYETYDRILEAIDGDDRRDALRLLQCLVTITFRANGNSVGDNSEDNYGDDSYGDNDDYEGSSDGASIDYHDDNRALLTEAGEITLAHFSVREYLISEHLRTSTTAISHYYFNEKMAHVFIAKTCLAYLLQFDQDNGVRKKKKKVLWNTALSYPLSHYAAHNWLDHAGWDPAGDWDDLHGLIMMLLEPTSAVYVNWMWLYDQFNIGATLSIAAKTGSGGFDGTALGVAALRGHGTIVQLLLEKGADVNAHGGVYGSALQSAALEGHHTIVLLLIEKGADVNAHRGIYGSALQMVASLGHDMTIRLLIEKGAGVNVQGENTGIALQKAALCQDWFLGVNIVY